MKRGDVYLANLNPVKGSEQAGTRPVLIYQDDRLIPQTLTILVIPFTTNLKLQKLPTALLVPRGEGGLREDSVLLCHQIRALDKAGLIDYWGTLSSNRLHLVTKTLLRTMGIR